jgi:hypothetical protein
MDQTEIDSFVMTGRNALTILGQAAEMLKRWSDSFEQRGGGAVFGDDATQIVYLANDLAVWLTPERQATIARLRTDV